MPSSIERATDYRRRADHLRKLSHVAKSEVAQQEFSRCARLYDRLADAAPAIQAENPIASVPRPRSKHSSKGSHADSD